MLGYTNGGRLYAYTLQKKMFYKAILVRQFQKTALLNLILRSFHECHILVNLSSKFENFG